MLKKKKETEWNREQGMTQHETPRSKTHTATQSKTTVRNTAQMLYQLDGRFPKCWINRLCVLTVTFHEERTYIWTASSEFGTYRLCEQRRFRRACASAQSRQNLHCSLIQAVSQEEPSGRKPDPWPLWMAGHAQLKLVMTECSKTQIRLTGLIWYDIR